MYSFYFITNDEEVRKKLNARGYNEYPKSKQQVNNEIRSNNAKKTTLCRDQKFIDVYYLLDNLLQPATTNLIMLDGDNIVGILNFVINKENILIIEAKGLCVDNSAIRGAGILLLNYFKLVSSALDAKQIKIFIVDKAIAPFYEKNGFQRSSEFNLFF